MSVIARQSTARIVTVGPVMDADGAFVTTLDEDDFEISKNGGAYAALNGSATATYDAAGRYLVALTTSDLDTVGSAEIGTVDGTNACPVKVITVVEEAVYDALFAASATGLLPANVTQISGDSTAADTLELFAEALDQATGQLDGGSFNGVLPTNFSALGIEATGEITEVATLTGHTAQTGDVFAALPTNFADLAIEATDGGVTLADGVTHGGTTATLRLGTTGSGAAFHVTNGGVGHAVLWESTVGVGAGIEGGSGGLELDGGGGEDLIATLIDTNFGMPYYTAVQSGLSTLDAAGVRTAVGLASANLDTQLEDLPTAAENRAEMDSNSTQLAAIVADTNELQADWADGGRLDVLVDAIKLVTDALTQAAAAKLALSAGTIQAGTVDTGSFSATTTQFEADDITEATADHYIGRIIIFTSGALQYQATDITDYALSGSNGHFTVSALTEAPANDVTFIII